VINDLPPGGPDVADAGGTAAEVEALGRRTLIHYGDISDPSTAGELVAAAATAFGRVDIAVANAAFSMREPVVEARWEHVLRTIEVTQFGAFHTCQAAARHMVARGGSGKIIIIGSVLAVIATFSWPSTFETAGIGTLSASISVAAVWRRSWKRTIGVLAFAAQRWKCCSRSEPWMGAPVSVTNTSPPRLLSRRRARGA
jgi:NAD(P)-dependent dehydrogenase (short-subunit alcohol dehydrogenase family)